MKSITVDFTRLEEADDGSTTHYGGFVVVGGAEIRAGGTDRDSYGWPDQVIEAMEEELGSHLSDEAREELFTDYITMQQSGRYDVEDDGSAFTYHPLDTWPVDEHGAEAPAYGVKIEATLTAFGVECQRGYELRVPIGVDVRRVLALLFEGFEDRLKAAGIPHRDV